MTGKKLEPQANPYAPTPGTLKFPDSGGSESACHSVIRANRGNPLEICRVFSMIKTYLFIYTHTPERMLTKDKAYA